MKICGVCQRTYTRFPGDFSKPQGDENGKLCGFHVPCVCGTHLFWTMDTIDRAIPKEVIEAFERQSQEVNKGVETGNIAPPSGGDKT